MNGRVVASLVAAFAALATGCARGGASPTAAATTPTGANPAPPTADGPRFRDVAGEAGLAYVWFAPGKRPLNIRQTIGNGCAFLDYDGDGNLDILLVGTSCALFRGDGKGRFADVSAASGVRALKGEFLGCAVGDYDGDARPDLYLSAYRGGVLLHNDAGRAFRDVTLAAGLKSQPWGTSCAFADFDADGRLDLYVGNYADFGPKTEPQMCRFGSVLGACGPRYYRPLRGVLYRNTGGVGTGVRFADVTAAWGADDVSGKCLGVAAADWEGSGRVGLALANDEVPGDLLRPLPVGGGGMTRFENVAVAAGTAHDAAGSVHGGMGTDWGDYDNDGWFDLVVATFSNEAKSVYHNDGGGVFADRAAALGLAGPLLPYVAFGVKWADFDNDGWLDLAFANGHVQDTIAEVDRGLTYRQTLALLKNRAGTGFALVPPEIAGPDFSRPLVGRGLATGDYDNDGKIDLLVVDSEGKPLLLRNETPAPGQSLTVRLTDRAGREASGATVTAEFAGRRLLRHCHADGSYLSSSDSRVHFGLGDHTGPVRVVVRWSGGGREAFDVAAGTDGARFATLKEGSGRQP